MQKEQPYPKSGDKVIVTEDLFENHTALVDMISITKGSIGTVVSLEDYYAYLERDGHSHSDLVANIRHCVENRSGFLVRWDWVMPPSDSDSVVLGRKGEIEFMSVRQSGIEWHPADQIAQTKGN